MKKFVFTIISVVFVSFLITSCDKKDSDPAEEFSKMSVEENKALVEDSGIDLMGVMNRMESIETIEPMISFIDLASNAGSKGFPFSGESKLLSVFKTFVTTAKGKGKLNSIFDAMSSAGELKSDDPESIEQFWNENTGTYTWNTSINDWDIVTGGDKIIFQFPSSDAASVNDATLTLNDYSGVTIMGNPIDDEYSGDLPVSLNADLKVGTKTLVTFVFGASYNSDGVPNAIGADLNIETFKFEVDIANTTEVVSVNYKFLENNDVIMDMGATGNGLFTGENYEENTESFVETYEYMDYVWNQYTGEWEEVPVTYTDEWEETEFEEILNSANARFRLLNIELRGDIDVKGLVDKIRIIEEEYDNEQIDSETYDSRCVEEINKFLNLRLINLSNNEIMAKAEAYVVHESDYYDDYTYIGFQLTFGDDSPIDVETYFEEGFDDFIAEMNSLIDDINSDYDLDIENVDY